MTTRQTRSASIPIPRTSSSLSPSRNIESVISIPFTAPGRPRLASAQVFPHRNSAADDHRGVGVSYGARGSITTAIATSPTRSTARSLTHAAGSGRGSLRSPSTYEPRVVRVTGEASRSIDAGCLPSTSPSRTRRTSVTGARATSAQRPTPSYTVAAPPPPVSFPRPTYLEHSALRHILQTESPPALPPSRKAEGTTHHGIPVFAGAMTPSSDSDDDSNVSPPRELSSAPPPPVSQDQILMLPTRWSDQFRHSLLSLSGDGRDLTYHGRSHLVSSVLFSFLILLS